MPADPYQIPLISILVNNYNYGRFVCEAIDSALAQDYPRIEVIVVDDGSTDDSPEKISRYGDRVRAIFQPNAGQAAAFNAGFAASRGEIICFLDADDRFRPGKASAIAELYRSYPDASWVFHKLALFGDVAPVAVDAAATGEELIDVRADVARGRLRRTAPATSALTFRRELLGRILPMPVEIRITSDNYLKFAALGTAPGVLSGDLLADQRIHGSNAYTLNPAADSLRGEIAMTTARYLRQRFPQLKRFAHGIYARGLSQWLASTPRGAGGSAIAKQYVRDLGPLDMSEVVARSAANVLRRVAGR